MDTEFNQEQFDKETAKLDAELALGDDLAELSQYMEIREALDEATKHGFEYGHGFEDGFWQGREIMVKYDVARSQAITDGYAKIKKLLGLDSLEKTLER